MGARQLALPLEPLKPGFSGIQDERVLHPDFFLIAPRVSEEGLVQVFTSLSHRGCHSPISRDGYNLKRPFEKHSQK